jgi:hypothetical protein
MMRSTGFDDGGNGRAQLADSLEHDYRPHERRPLHPRAGRAGQAALRPDQAKRAQELYDGHAAELAPIGRARAMSPAAAEAVATKRTLDALDFEALEKRRRTLLQVKAQDFAEDWLTRGGEHWGGGDRGGGDGGGMAPGEGPIGPANPEGRRRP